MILEPEVEKRIIYIPVADATQGNTPKLNNRGLNMAPPPSPRAPDMKPPRKANVTNFKSMGSESLRSEGAIPAPNLIFSFCS